MTVKIKLRQLDQVNRNGYKYSKECMDDIYTRYKDVTLPIKLISVGDSNPPIVGLSKITKMNYPEMEMSGQLETSLILSLIEKNIGGFGINATLDEKDISVTDGYSTINKITKINSIGYTINPSQVCSYEIIKEDDNDTGETSGS